MSDKIVQCLHCLVHVQPKKDGTCPSCQANALEEPTKAEVLQIQCQKLKTQKHLLVDAVRGNLLQGLAWLVSGLVVTGVTYINAASRPEGGRYIFAHGAIFGGLIQIFVGIGKVIELRRLTKFEKTLVEEADYLDSPDSPLAA